MKWEEYFSFLFRPFGADKTNHKRYVASPPAAFSVKNFNI